MSQPPEWSAPDASGDPHGTAPGEGPVRGAGAPAAAPDGTPVPSGPPPGHHFEPGAPGGWATQAWGPQPAAHGWAPGSAGPPQPAYGAAPAWGAAPGWTPGRPRPGIIPLRPIALGEIYDGAFRAIRSNPRTMIGIAAIVIAAILLITAGPQAAALQNFGESDLFDPQASADVSAGDVAAEFSGLFASILIPALLQALAVTVVSGLLIVAVSNAVLGRSTAPGQLWRRTRRRVPALIVLAVVVQVAVLVLSLSLPAPGLLLIIAGQTPLGVALLLSGALLGVVVYVALYYGLWSLSAPALLLEDLSVAAALRRSWRLVRRSFWRVVGIMLLTFLLVSVLSGIISAPFTILSSLMSIAQDSPYSNFPLTLAQLLVGEIGTIISGAVLYPFSAAVTALLYIDLRMRQEGLDVELMRATGVPGA